MGFKTTLFQKRTQLDGRTQVFAKTQVNALTYPHAATYGTVDGIDWPVAAMQPIIDEMGTELPFGSLFVKNVTTAVVFIRHFG